MSLLALIAAAAWAQPAPEPLQVDDPLLAPIAEPAEKVATLEDALFLLRSHSSDLRIQAERVRVAESERSVALSRVLPSLSASALAQQNVLDPGRNFIVGGGAGGPAGGGGLGPTGEGQRPTHVLGLGTLSAAVPLVDVAAWQGVVAAGASRQAAIHSREDLQRTLVRDLSRRLIRAATVERLSELERVSLRNALERLELGRRSFRLGASNRLDLVRLEQDFQVSRGAVLEANEALHRAREDLGLLLGRNHEVGLAAGFNLDGLLQQARKVCQPVDRLASREDLLAQEWLVTAARKRLDDARLQYLPALMLRSDVFALTVEPGPIAVPAWNVAAVLSINLWDGGRRSAQSTRAQAELRVAEEQAALIARQAQVEVKQALRSIGVARDRHREATWARDLAQESDALTRRAFELGRGSSLDLVQAASILRQAQVNLALREFDLVAGVIDAFSALSACDL